MNNTSRRRADLERLYHQLRQSLAQTGYISQGSVLQRSVATSGRSGFQWTRKVAQKTVTMALSRDQFLALSQAVRNQRSVQRYTGLATALQRACPGSTLRSVTPCPCPTPTGL